MTSYKLISRHLPRLIENIPWNWTGITGNRTWISTRDLPNTQHACITFYHDFPSVDAQYTRWGVPRSMQRKGFRWSVTTEPLKARSVYSFEITKLRAAQSLQKHFLSAVRAVVSKYDRMSFLLLPPPEKRCIYFTAVHLPNEWVLILCPFCTSIKTWHSTALIPGHEANCRAG